MSALEDLLTAAREAMSRAYAPYSGHCVGAALRTRSGHIFSGCNVENAAYPQGWCAETSALAAMVGGGEREVDEVVVMADADGVCTPCGGCRQKLSEFADPTIAVHACGPEGVRASFTLGELLPHRFGADNLHSERD